MRRFKPLPSLVPKLALIYLGLALLAALLVRGVVLTGEVRALDRELDRGWLGAATAAEAARFGARLDGPTLPRRTAVDRDLDAVLVDLRAPRDPNGGPADVLAEFPDSLSVSLFDRDGRAVAHRGAREAWSWNVTLPTKLLQDLANRGVRPVPNGRTGGAWRYLGPVRARSGEVAGYLEVRLRVLPPGWRALLGDSFEAPAVVVYALVFALGSALFLNRLVTCRLERMAQAAEAWGGGDFHPRVGDSGADEIGRLGRRLDLMAGELEGLVALRARLAGLDERERLGRELHDTVKQKAFALQLQLAALARTPDQAGPLEEARRIASEIQRELASLIEVEQLAADTSPGAFPFQLAAQAETWGRRGGFQVQTSLAAAEAVPLSQRPILVRILDEALANVMRHSGAKLARVELRRRGTGFELVVRDDGRGPGEASSGMGLANMRHRASALPQGELVLTDARPGARLTVRWGAPEGVAA
jgi:signal transduction histidine kinase